MLQFSHERRDRRKREYVMIEQNHDSIIDILAPISEENQKAFSLASKVEVRYTVLESVGNNVRQCLKESTELNLRRDVHVYVYVNCYAVLPMPHMYMYMYVIHSTHPTRVQMLVSV